MSDPVATTGTTPNVDPAASGRGAWIFKYLFSFLDPLKSRTNASALAGLIAYFFQDQGVTLDQAAVTEAIVAGANADIGLTLDVQDLIIVGMVIAVTYFRSNPRISYSSKV